MNYVFKLRKVTVLLFFKETPPPPYYNCSNFYGFSA